MRKINLFVLLLGVVFIYSCGKTNKRKLSNDWIVNEMTQETYFESSVKTETFEQDEEREEETTVNGDSYVFETVWNRETSTYNPGLDTWNTNKEDGDDRKEAEVLEFSFSIDKEGNWTKVFHLLFKEDGETTEIMQKESGKWSFVSKSEEFKKNERVLFNILESDEKFTVTDEDGNEISSDEAKTYAMGENTMIYVVVESSKDELTLSLDEDFKYVFDQGYEIKTLSSVLHMIPAED